MKALRLFVLLEKAVASSTFVDCKLVRTCNYTSLASATCQRWSFFSEESEEESPVYKHALKFKQPSTIKYKEEFRNSVSLIGIVELPLKRVKTGDGSLGVHTMLKLKTSSHCYTKILLKMWDEMAEVSINHLKPDDFIYVQGHLASYQKTANDGNPNIFYEVIVKEINFVAENAEVPIRQQKKRLHLQDADDRKRDRIHLWQVFFANPYEWYDNRKTKKNPTHPDFRHKSSGEALWLSPYDPPWISRQLQFLDSLIQGQDQEGYSKSNLCSFLPENNSAWRNQDSY